ncbi:MAG: tripartite tricarboxylate transporter substrate binding protein [Burkholderiales bacterium]|nr:tripartite tricarboxylate transporter substrate binding protein [Burkholderiales bacterium]
MPMNIRVLAAALLGTLACTAHAQNYPAKTVRVIVPFAPGGGSDFIARQIAPPLTKAMGQQFVVDNRPGAGSTLGSEIALKSPPDGYTLLLISGSYTTSPSLYKNLKYDPLNDMASVIQTENGPYVVTVHPSLPAKTVKELVAIAKSKPGQLNYASTGNGGITHLSAELFALRTGIKITHIPYKGTGPGVIDTIAGNTQMMIAAVSAVIGHMQNGRLRGLAVSSPKRLPALPDIPTVMENGIKYQVNNWHGVIAPKGTPKTVIDRLNAEINKAVKEPEFARRIAQDGLEPAGGTPEEFYTLLKREVAEWAEVVKAANVRAD